MSKEITREKLNPAFKEMMKCGLSEEKANQEIGFALNQINSKDNLKKSNLDLINNAVSQVAYTGLSLNHLKQEAVISDYSEKKQKGVFFMPMYRGLLKTAIIEGAILGANTQVVNEGDLIEINAASFKNPVNHVIKAFGKKRTAVVTYTVLALPSGLESLTLFYEDEYDNVKPKGDKFSPHTNWANEMRKKSCLKRALKTVASVSDSKLEHLIALDNLNYTFDPTNNNPPPPEDEAEKGKETLTEKHENYKGIIKALTNETHSWETIEENIIVPKELKAKIDIEVNKLKTVTV